MEKPRTGFAACAGFFIFLMPLAAEWRLSTTPLRANLRGVGAVSPIVVWASGTNGTVVQSTDGGVNFFPRPVPGGETLSYRDMVARIGAATGRRALLLPLPVAALSALIAVLRRSPRFRGLSPDMALRMQQDLCFDSAEARRDFGYAPGPFRLDAEALGLPVAAGAALPRDAHG